MTDRHYLGSHDLLAHPFGDGGEQLPPAAPEHRHTIAFDWLHGVHCMTCGATAVQLAIEKSEASRGGESMESSVLTCRRCGEPIEPGESYYEPTDPNAPLHYWHEDCADEEAIENDEIYLVEPGTE